MKTLALKIHHLLVLESLMRWKSRKELGDQGAGFFLAEEWKREKEKQVLEKERKVLK